MNRTIWMLIAIAATSVILAAAPKPKPDFSGTWQLDTLRSRYNAKVPAPKSATLIIEQRGSNLRIALKTVTVKGPQDYDFELAVDGVEVSKTTDGQPYTALARWGDIDGTRLVLTIKHETPTGAMETSRLMRLGDKGRILTTVLTIKDSSGKRKANEFYTK